MSRYKKPKRIKIVLWLMVVGIIGAAVVGVIVPWLPTGSDDISEMTADLYQTIPADSPDVANFDDTPSDPAQPIMPEDQPNPDTVVMEPTSDEDTNITNDEDTNNG